MSFSKCPERTYAEGSKLSCVEDSTHEFKGHRNLAVEELPKWCFVPGSLRRSRKAVSRTLNAFLNSNKGGKVYLGVLDDGTVAGIPLSQFQITHIKLSLNDLMRRYEPQVPQSRYKVGFVLVRTKEDQLHMTRLDDSAYSSEEGDDTSAAKPHVLRASVFCWCDRQAILLFKQGLQQRKYVIEICVSCYQRAPGLNSVALQLHPVYQDEENRCYFRMSASLVSYSHQEVAELTRNETRVHFEKVIQRLRRELRLYEKLLLQQLIQP